MGLLFTAQAVTGLVPSAIPLTLLGVVLLLAVAVAPLILVQIRRARAYAADNQDLLGIER